MTTTADYGEQGPEHFDRFGLRHNVTYTPENGPSRTFMDANPRGIIKRLGLTLFGGSKKWPGMELFFLEVWGRPLEIRSYSDGRIKLFLDGQPVYTENTKIVTRHGVKYREVEQWFDPAVDEEERQAADEARMTDVKTTLQQRLAELNGRGPHEVVHVASGAKAMCGGPGCCAACDGKT